MGSERAEADVSLRSENATLLNQFIGTLNPPLSKAQLAQVDVPAVGCPQDGQMGPQKAPKLPTTVRVTVPEGMASSLAYYSPYEDISDGVLAPRGWDCFGVYGSNGASLFVVPDKLGDPILDRPKEVENGLLVVRRFVHGDTSGRYEVAEISARLFPRARPYIESVRKLIPEIDNPNAYVFAPWPTDRVNHLSDFAVSYITPPQIDGLGSQFWLAPAAQPISGLVFLTGDLGGQGEGPFLHGLAVRLDPRDQYLYSAIAIEMIASMDLKTAAPIASEKERENAGVLGVVTAFYEALGRGDGFAAAELVIPEKRARGPLSADAMTHFYSQLSEPLQLISVSQLDKSTVLARYQYRTGSGKLCKGRANVTITSVNGTNLIQSIKALDGC
jgi:hypothetical protein